MFCNCTNLKEVKVHSNSSRFFSNRKYKLFKSCNEVTIIPMNELDRIVTDLFY